MTNTGPPLRWGGRWWVPEPSQLLCASLHPWELPGFLLLLLLGGHRGSEMEPHSLCLCWAGDRGPPPPVTHCCDGLRSGQAPTAAGCCSSSTMRSLMYSKDSSRATILGTGHHQAGALGTNRDLCTCPGDAGTGPVRVPKQEWGNPGWAASVTLESGDGDPGVSQSTEVQERGPSNRLMRRS